MRPCGLTAQLSLTAAALTVSIYPTEIAEPEMQSRARLGKALYQKIHRITLLLICN